MARNFAQLLDFDESTGAVDGSMWSQTRGKVKKYDIGSPWAVAFASNRLFIAYTYDTVT
jgi:hypothetical protein